MEYSPVVTPCMTLPWQNFSNTWCHLPAGDCWEAVAEGSTLSHCLQGVDITPTPASRDQVLSPYLLHIRSCTHSRNCNSSCNPRPVLAGAGNTHTVPPCLAPGWWAAKAWEEIREITLFLFTAFPHHVWGFELTCTPLIQEALILCTGLFSLPSIIFWRALFFREGYIHPSRLYKIQLLLSQQVHFLPYSTVLTSSVLEPAPAPFGADSCLPESQCPKE